MKPYHHVVKRGSLIAGLTLPRLWESFSAWAATHVSILLSLCGGNFQCTAVFGLDTTIAPSMSVALVVRGIVNEAHNFWLECAIYEQKLAQRQNIFKNVKVSPCSSIYRAHSGLSAQWYFVFLCFTTCKRQDLVIVFRARVNARHNNGILFALARSWSRTSARFPVQFLYDQMECSGSIFINFLVPTNSCPLKWAVQKTRENRRTGTGKLKGKPKRYYNYTRHVANYVYDATENSFRIKMITHTIMC